MNNKVSEMINKLLGQFTLMANSVLFYYVVIALCTVIIWSA